MNTNKFNWPHDEALADLMVLEATEGLGEADRGTLEAHLRRQDTVDPDAVALAVAGAELAFMAEAGGSATMPVHLVERVVAGVVGADRPAHDAPISFERESRRFSASMLGWLAAAAMLVLAVSTWVINLPEAPPSYAEQRTALLAEAGDAITVAWAPGEDPVYGKVTGDVVWSDAKQQGYMRLKGLPVNDPTKQQYQLWIVDPDVDQFPVDGGVFDVTETGEVVVPIDAKLEVDQPVVFAITVEKPGGVVKSAGPLRVVAPVG